jgi:hypothetical protein
MSNLCCAVDKDKDGHEDRGGDVLDDEIADGGDDDEEGGVGERTTTSAASPSRYARYPISNAKPAAKNQV